MSGIVKLLVTRYQFLHSFLHCFFTHSFTLFFWSLFGLRCLPLLGNGDECCSLEWDTTDQEKPLHSSQIIPFPPAMANMARIHSVSFHIFIPEAAWSHRGPFYFLKKYVRLRQELSNYRFGYKLQTILFICNNMWNFLQWEYFPSDEMFSVNLPVEHPCLGR